MLRSYEHSGLWMDMVFDFSSPTGKHVDLEKHYINFTVKVLKHSYKRGQDQRRHHIEQWILQFYEDIYFP